MNQGQFDSTNKQLVFLLEIINAWKEVSVDHVMLPFVC